MSTSSATHSLLVPIKPPARGKTRLSGVPAEARSELARAFALDSLEAVLAADRVGAVLVVTDDATLAGEAVALGATAIPDGVSEDLNATLVQAAAEAHRRWPALVPAALCGDLPALRSAELDEALAGAPPAYVADASGTGTTLYTAAYDAFSPGFGPDSARVHEAGGATAVPGELVGLRRDVDTLEDLAEARRLGLGARTTLAAVRYGLLGG